jgi:hypothetical protein
MDTLKRVEQIQKRIFRNLRATTFSCGKSVYGYSVN